MNKVDLSSFADPNDVHAVKILCALHECAHALIAHKYQLPVLGILPTAEGTYSVAIDRKAFDKLTIAQQAELLLAGEVAVNLFRVLHEADYYCDLIEGIHTKEDHLILEALFAEKQKNDLASNLTLIKEEAYASLNDYLHKRYFALQALGLELLVDNYLDAGELLTHFREVA